MVERQRKFTKVKKGECLVAAQVFREVVKKKWQLFMTFAIKRLPVKKKKHPVQSSCWWRLVSMSMSAVSQSKGSINSCSYTLAKIRGPFFSAVFCSKHRAMLYFSEIWTGSIA